MDFFYADTLALDPDIIVSDGITVDHQLERSLHPDPPARRLHLRNPGLRDIYAPVPRSLQLNTDDDAVLIKAALEDQSGIRAGNDLE